ncbi:MAG: hypothetical protein LRY68_06675 [Sulfurospirillum sp.]|nr:hypothetical protein [Sulfurospirillum sp.]
MITLDSLALLFYFVENAQKIKSDVTLLVCVSSLLLALLYLLFLKNIGLLFNTLLSLASSVMLSFILLSFIWSDISLFCPCFWKCHQYRSH